VSDSICINGACLTVTSRDAATFSVDVVPETLRRTNLGSLGAGDPVNLERSLAVSARFGGHIVQGHVDATGAVEPGIDQRTHPEHERTAGVAHCPRRLQPSRQQRWVEPDDRNIGPVDGGYAAQPGAPGCAAVVHRDPVRAGELDCAGEAQQSKGELGAAFGPAADPEAGWECTLVARADEEDIQGALTGHRLDRSAWGRSTGRQGAWLLTGG
jgi:hypothetical protein